MIDPIVISRVRNGVCAVGYLTVPLNKYLRKIRSPFFQVVGTGFLIREATVITNRHVINALMMRQANLGFPSSQFFIQFYAPTNEPQPNLTIRMIRHFSVLSNESLDIGFLEFDIIDETHFHDISPLDIASTFDFHVSDEIAICGYPYGTAMLTKNSKVYRWGPIIQQGYISAVSPFDNVTEPDELLLDIRTAGGMSGAPIFKPSTGEVIGIHHSGREATTAYGLPFTNKTLNNWLEVFDDEQHANGGDQSNSFIPIINSS